jgi:tetratricopeptide (TPR) repeat protein
MTGTFNVALADFAKLDNGGQAEAVEDGRTMSTWLFKGLIDKALGPNFSIWHDSMDPTQKRVTIGVIPGSTKEARQANAVKVAKSINADMLVYGVLAGGASSELELEFYLAPLSDQIDEIADTYSLGSPITVTLPVRYSQTRAEVEDILVDRSQILTYFAQGFHKDKTHRPAEALQFFEKALDPDLWSSDRRGQEVIHLFVGREHYALATDYENSGQPEQALEEYRKAHEAFGRAKARNPDYARAFVGDGNVYLALSRQKPRPERLEAPCVDLDRPDQTLESPCLELAIEQYARAVELTEMPGGSGAFAGVRAHIGLGGAYRIKAESYMYRKEYDASMSFFDMAIEEQGKVLALLKGQDQPGYVALSNLYLGIAYRLKADVVMEGQQDRTAAGTLYDKAHAAYTQCIEAASAQPGDQDVQALAGQCGSLRDDVDKARAALGTGP